MSAGLLSWPAQLAAHQRFIADHAAAAQATPKPGAPRHGGIANRQKVLHALRDGAAHYFPDIAAALPHLSRQGAYYVIDALVAERLITATAETRTRRRYQLAQGARHEH